MKHVCVNLKEMKYPITLDAFYVEFMDIGKGVLHIRCEYKDYYYPLEMVESCVVRDDD